MDALSLGLRGEVVGATDDDDVLAAIAANGYETDRYSVLAQVGFHF